MNDLGGDADRSGQNNMALFGNGTRFNDAEIQFAPEILGVKSVTKVLGEHRKVLVVHANATGVDTLLDILTALVGPAPRYHVKGSPAIFRLGADGSTDEQVEAHFTLKIVLFHVVSQCFGDDLGVSDRGEPGPTKVHAVFEVGQNIFNGSDTIQ